MPWHAQLHLNYRRDGARSVLDDRHSGPLRVLQSLYPEGLSVCHNVLIHPPGGVVGGDVLAVEAEVGAGAHALVTTAGATRFYRSAGELARQTLRVRLADAARFEWLPLETICHPAAQVENRLRFELAPGAEMIGWDLLALGLPASAAPFDRGRVTQHIELPGVWLERGHIDATDRRLLESPLGWAGHPVMATMWLAAGAPLAPTRVETLLDATRERLAAQPLAATSGCSAPHPQVIVLRALAPQVESAWTLLTTVWRRWRELAWQLPACAPRIWRS